MDLYAFLTLGDLFLAMRRAIVFCNPLKGQGSLMMSLMMFAMDVVYSIGHTDKVSTKYVDMKQEHT